MKVARQKKQTVRFITGKELCVDSLPLMVIEDDRSVAGLRPGLPLRLAFVESQAHS